MIGLGTQDGPDQAVEFVEQYGTYSFPMLWDETFESWSVFGLRSQPAAALLAPDGTILGGWLGPVPESEVLELVGASG